MIVTFQTTKRTQEKQVEMNIDESAKRKSFSDFVATVSIHRHQPRQLSIYKKKQKRQRFSITKNEKSFFGGIFCIRQ